MRKFNYSIIALAMLVWACGGTPTQPQEPREPQAGEGVVQLPLTSTGPDGQRYRLVGATFAITGTQAVTITDTSADTVRLPLMAGSYTIQLEGPWRMERVEAPGQSVPASLISPNPMAFSVDEGQVRNVRFLFKLPGNGNADVGFTVDTGGWLTGTFAFEPLPEGSEPGHPLASLAGTRVPFVISWATSIVDREYSFGSRVLEIEAQSPTIQFGGPYSALLHDRIAPGLQNSPLHFEVMASSDGQMTFGNLYWGTSEGEHFFLEIHPSMPFPGVLDAEGFPAPRPFDFQSMFSLRSEARFEEPLSGVATVNASVE